jgi:nucleoid-associated protein YgaU
MTEKYEVVSGDTLWALAERFYGDGSRYPVISTINNLSDPGEIVVGQELEIPYVTYRHQVLPGDTKNSLAQQFYDDIWMAGIIEVANHAGQRDLVVGEWLMIPDLANVGHHTVVAGETLQELAEDWYGEANLWPIISMANFLGDQDPSSDQVLIQPRLNRRHTVVEGDTLWQLAADNYNYDLDRTQTALRVLAAANHVADPDTIEVGQVIFFPSMA